LGGELCKKIQTQKGGGGAGKLRIGRGREGTNFLGSRGGPKDNKEEGQRTGRMLRREVTKITS